MTNTELLQIIIRALPYPGQMHSLQIEETCVRFGWRSQFFRVDTSLHVETMRDGMLIGDDASILMRALLEQVAFK